MFLGFSSKTFSFLSFVFEKFHIHFLCLPTFHMTITGGKILIEITFWPFLFAFSFFSLTNSFLSEVFWDFLNYKCGGFSDARVNKVFGKWRLVNKWINKHKNQKLWITLRSYHDPPTTRSSRSQIFHQFHSFQLSDGIQQFFTYFIRQHFRVRLSWKIISA